MTILARSRVHIILSEVVAHQLIISGADFFILRLFVVLEFRLFTLYLYSGVSSKEMKEFRLCYAVDY